MSDRVASIGGFGLNVDPSIAGTGATGLHQIPGRDHFQFAIADYFPSSVYPMAIPLAEAMLLAWRIRKWRFHGSLSNTRNGGTANFDWIATVGDDLGRDIGEQASQITREAELLINGSAMDSTDGLDEEDGGQYELALLLGAGLVYDSPDNFRPYLAVRTFGSTEIDCVLDSRAALAGGGGAVTSVDAYINIAGTHRSLVMYKNALESGTITGTIAIDPIEYWPYATKAGDPVYDTSTGEQLADPFS